MTTVEEVARSVVAALHTDAGYLLASRWVSERYRQLCSRSRFRHLRRVGVLAVPANVTAGTVTVARGSRVVTGDATARAAWSNALVGRFVRASVTWYEVDEITASGDLHLVVEYAESDVTAGTYVVVARRLSLDPSVRWLGDAMVQPRRRWVLGHTSLTEMDTAFPARDLVDGGPRLWAEVGVAADQSKVIEVYPYTATSEVVQYTYWPTPPDLGLRDPLPTVIDGYALKEGALIDLLRFEMARAAQRGDHETAALLRNDYRAQSTVWERVILEAIRADRGTDDVTFLLNATGMTQGVGPGDITTAYDQVLSRWPR
jgi:hypothetical protein